MRIQRPTITAPTITEVQSLAGSGANITGSFQGAFDGTLTGATSASLALGVATNLASITALDDTYASDSQLTSVSSSLASDISVNASAIAGLDSTYATDASLNASSSTLQSSIDTKSSITQLNASSSTLQGNIDTIGSGQTSALNTSSSTLQGNIDTLGTNQTAALNTSSSALQTNIDLKADIASPTFTGTVSGITSTMVGLGNVDNTTDANKPVSTAGQTALNLKATIASPTFTGDVIAPTVTDGADSSAKVATTSFVQGRITALIGGAGEAFDTLLEISGSISNGDSDVVALTATVGGKLAKASNLSDLGSAETARGNLGLSNVDNTSDATKNAATATLSNKTIAASQVTEISGLTAVEGAQLEAIGTTTISADQWGYLGAASAFGATLLDDADAATSRTTLGLGNVTNTSDATKNAAAVTLSNKTIAISQVTELSGLTDVEGAQLENIDSTTISTAQWGYLGATSAFGATLIDDADAASVRTTIGLENVDNTSDATKDAAATTLTNKTIAISQVTELSNLTDVEGAQLENIDTTTISSQQWSYLGDSNQHVKTNSNVQFNSFGVGTVASSTPGEIRATGDITAYYSSDERLKENFAPLAGALDKVKAMGGYEFDWKDGIEDVVSKTGHDIGVKAQEVQAQYPELVHERDNGYLAVDYIKLNAVLIEAVKELAAQVEELSK